MTDHRNPFTSEEQPSMADLLYMIEKDMSLDPARQNNVACSVRRLCHFLNIDVGAAPAHPGYYRKKLSDLSPQRLGVSKTRLGNIKADVRWAFNQYIKADGQNTYLTPLSEDWRALSASLGGGRLAWTLSRFMRYCSAQGIKPGDVSDEVSSSFLQALTEETFVDNPKDLHRRSCKAWNKAVDTVPDWPQVRLTRPSYRTTYTLPWPAFPDTLRADIDRWKDRLRGVDLLAEHGLDRPLAERTIETRDFQLRQLASALVHQGMGPHEITSLGVMTELSNTRLALKFFLDRSDNKPTVQIAQLAHLLRSIAKYHLEASSEVIAEYSRLVNRLTPERHGMTDKNRDKLRQFEDPQNVHALLEYPSTAVRRLDGEKQKTRSQAVQCQIALAVEMLLMMPIRMGNLVSLNIETHLHRSRGKGDEVHLVIPGEEVKNKEPLEFRFPVETLSLLDLYLKEYRPLLLDKPSSWLFPGRGGAHKVRSVLSNQISRHIQKATGLNVNPHLFRHLAAKLYLDENPGGYEVVRRLLAHRSMQTTINAYAGLETKSAAAHFDQTILDIRDALRNQVKEIEDA